MPKLLSGGVLQTGSSSSFITLAQAQPALQPTPSTTTGFLLILPSASNVEYTNVLGNITFDNGSLTNYTNYQDISIYTPVGGFFQVYSPTYINQTLVVTSATNSAASTDGALVVAGGAGIQQNLHVGGTIYADSNIQTYGTQSGSLVVTGGAGISGDVIIGNNLLLPDPATGNISAQTINVVGNVNAYGTNSGALIVNNGVGVGGSLYASKIFDNRIRVVSTILTGPGLSESTSTGPLIILTNTGVLSIIAGTGTFISSSTGNVTIWSQPTLQDVTNYGNSTTNIVLFNNNTNATTSSNGAVVIKGGLGVGKDAWISGTVYANNLVITNETGGIIKAALGQFTNVTITGTNFSTSTLANNALYVAGGIATQETLTVGSDAVIYGNLYVQGTYTQIVNQTSAIGRTIIALSTSSGPAIVDRGSGITVGPVNSPYASWLYDGLSGWVSSGNIFPSLDLNYNLGSAGLRWNHIYAGTALINSNIDSINTSSGSLVVQGGVGISRNAVIGGSLKVISGDPATSTGSGAIVVQGGVGIGGDIYAGNVYSNGVLIGNGYSYTFAGTDTAISTSNNTLSVWSTATFQSITQRSNTTDRNIRITNGTDSLSTDTGALVVSGGLGVGGNIYAGENVYINNSLAITSGTIGQYALTAIVASTDTAVSNATGVVTVWDISTLQSVTSRGKQTNENIEITNAISSTSTNSNQALLVKGGIGIGATLAASRAVIVNSTEATVTGTASLQVTGGAYIARNLIINTTTNDTYATGSNALYVAGGVGISGNLIVDGSSIFNGPAVFNGTSTYVYSTNTVYTDNIIELHVPPGGLPDVWNYDDGRDIGFRFHYFNKDLVSESNAALVLSNDSQYLEFYDQGSVDPTGKVFSGTNYGTFKTGAIQLISTATSALEVAGGIQVNSPSNFVGNNAISSTSTVSQQSITVSAGGIGIVGDSYFNNTVAIGGNLWVDGTLFGNLQTNNHAQNVFVTTTNVNSDLYLGFLNTLTGYAFEFVSTSLTYNPYLNITTFGGTADSTTSTTGTVIINGGLGVRKSVVIGGTLTSYGPVVIVDPRDTDGSQNSGALQVEGGIVVGKSIYASNIYDNNNRVVTSVTPIAGLGIAISSLTNYGPSPTFTINNFGVTNLSGSTFIGVSTSTGSVSITNLGVQTISAGTDTAVSTSTGTVLVWNFSNLQSVTDRGATTNHAINITNASNSININSGALVVAGGVGIGGALYINTTSYIANAQIITTATIGKYASGSISITAGTDTSVSTSGGVIRIWNTSTLQSITNRGNSTNNIINITNNTPSNSTDTGALVVTGGVGIGGTLYSSEHYIIHDTSDKLYPQGYDAGLFIKNIYAPITGITMEEVAGFKIMMVNSGGNFYLSQAYAPWPLGSDPLANPMLIANGTSTSVPLTTPAVSTNSGAFRVTGGVGIGGALYVGTASYIAGSQILTSATIGSYLTQATVITAGTDTAVSTSTGNITIWNTSTLQSVTTRGSTTTHSINITNSTPSSSQSTGALTVTGGVGIGGSLYAGTATFYGIGNTDYTLPNILLQSPNNGPSTIAASHNGAVNGGLGWTVDGSMLIDAPSGVFNFNNSSLTDTNYLQLRNGNQCFIYINPNESTIANIANNPILALAPAQTPSVSTNTGALVVNGGLGVIGAAYINTTSYIANAEILTSATVNTYATKTILTAGTDTAVSTSTGPIVIWNTSTLQSITSRGNSTYYSINITNNTQSTGTNSGALTVTGGVGIGGSVYIDRTSYISGAQIVTTATLAGSLVSRLIAGTDTAVSTSTGAITIWNTSTLQTITNRGNSTTNVVIINNNTTATSTTTGALIVAGGVGIGGALYINTTSYIANAEIITTATVNQYANQTFVSAGTDTAVSTSTGNVTIWNTSTLQTITNRGNSTTNTISIINSTTSADIYSGAFVVNGGVGIGGNVYIGATSYINGSEIVTTGSIATYAVSNLTAGTDTAISTSTGAVVIWNTSTLQSVTDRGATTTDIINILNYTNSAGTNSGALIVGGGIGLGSDLWIGGDVYADNGNTIINYSQIQSKVPTISLSVASTLSSLAVNSGLLIGNTASPYISWVYDGASNWESSGGIIIQSPAQSITTASGALIVAGGAGVGGNLFVGNTATIVSSDDATSTTTGALIVAGGVGIGGAAYINTTSYIANAEIITTATILNFATQSYLFAGTDTAVSTSTGNVTIWNTSTLQTITNRGNTTTNAISITNPTESNSTNTGALRVAGGVGIGGNLYVGGMITANTLTIQYTTITQTLVTSPDIFTIENTTTSVSTATGALVVYGGVGIGGGMYISTASYIAGSQIITTATVNLYATQTYIYGGTDTAVSTSTGNITIWNTSTLQTITSRGNSTNRQILITNTSTSISTVTGALQVSGGVGIGGNVNAGSYITVADGFYSISTFTGIYSDGIVVDYYNNGGATGTGRISVGANDVIALYTGGPNNTLLATFSSGTSSISSTASSISTNTGALTIAGGLGVGGAVYISTSSFIAGSQILTSATVNLYANQTYIYGGTDTTVSTSSGNIYIWNTSTLQSVTSRGAGTSNAINISNTATSTSPTTGALVVAGGVGIGGALNVYGTITATTATVGTTVGFVVNNSSIASYTSGAISTTTTQYLDVWSTSSYRSAKYIIQLADNSFTPNRVHVTEIMLFHDGAGSVYKTEYNVATNHGELGTFDTTMTGLGVQLSFTPSALLAPSNLVIKANRTSISL